MLHLITKKTITAIEIQKDNPNRVNIYFDGEFAFGLARIVAAWLKVGQQLEDERIARLQAEDEREQAYQRAMLFLSYRARSEAEIRHTALVPNWLKTVYARDPFFTDTASVYTIHNLAFQGIFGHRVLEIAGIDDYGFIVHPDTVDLNEVVDFMGRGIYFADVINTVSETHAREILTPEFGERLDPLLRDRQDRLFGILNGIDLEQFNPATDPYLETHYTLASLDDPLQNKLALQREAGLRQDARAPIVGVISRLTDQKGFDLITPRSCPGSCPSASAPPRPGSRAAR